LVASGRASQIERGAICELRNDERSSPRSAKARESAGRKLSRPRHSLDEDGDESESEEIATEEIDIVVAHIKRLARIASLEFALRVGAVIIHHFYEGDAEAWRSRGPKTASFRRLAEHPDLPLSPGSLYRCVALYELCDRLNAPSRWEHLGASHLRLVIGLPPPTQEKLLATANAKRWTVKVLHQEVLLEKAARLTRGGRRAQTPLTRSLMSVRKCLDDYRDVIERTGQLSLSDLERSLQLVEETRTYLECLSQSLRAAAGSANDGSGESSRPLAQASGKRHTQLCGIRGRSPVA
jgi:hypothetical protein